MYLIEAKQVGILYHFSKIKSLESIINDEALKNEEHNYISFTRNFNLTGNSKYFGEHTVRLTFDGDKLSNKFKIEPYNDKGWVKRSDNEQEERIKWMRFKPLKCFFALKRIDILNSADLDKEYWLKINLPIYFVGNFKPVK